MYRAGLAEWRCNRLQLQREETGVDGFDSHTRLGEIVLKKNMEETIAALSSLDEAAFQNVATLLCKTLEKGNKILVCGNGGSAADAQHFAAEIVCTFFNRNRGGLPCLALTTNTSSLTAWANDFGYDGVFARQVEAFGKRGDVLFSITTSGNSPNIVEAMEKARSMGIVNVLLAGKDGGKAKDLADHLLLIKHNSTPRIQEAHIFTIHNLCEIIDQYFSK